MGEASRHDTFAAACYRIIFLVAIRIYDTKSRLLSRVLGTTLERKTAQAHGTLLRTSFQFLRVAREGRKILTELLRAGSIL